MTGSDDGDAGIGSSFADKLETAVESFFTFLARFLETARRLVWPCNAYVISAVSSQRLNRRVVLPYTFLTLAYFPLAIMLAASADTVWDLLLAPERTAVDIAKRFSEGPSISHIIMIAAPALLVLLILRKALTLSFTLRTSGQMLLQRALAYAFGFQFLTASLLLLFAVVGHESFIGVLFPRPMVAFIQALTPPILFYGLFIWAIFYPCVALCFVALRLRRYWRWRTTPLIVAVFTLFGTIAVIYSGTFPSRVSRMLSPEVRVTSRVVAPLKVFDGHDVVISLYLSVENLTANTVIVSDRDMGVQIKDGSGRVIPKTDYTATFCGWSDGNAPIMPIRAGDVKYIHLVFDLGIDSHLYGAAARTGYLWIQVAQKADDVVRTDWSNVEVQSADLKTIKSDCRTVLDFTR